MALDKFKQFLRGSFTCIKCNREFTTMFFGFGNIICPHCYKGENNFIFLDTSYWLNRIISLNIVVKNVQLQKQYENEKKKHQIIQEYLLETQIS